MANQTNAGAPEPQFRHIERHYQQFPLTQDFFRYAPAGTRHALITRTVRVLLRAYPLQNLDQLHQLVEQEGWVTLRRTPNLGSQGVALIVAVLKNAEQIPACPQCARQRELEKQIAETQHARASARPA